jgi:hypothetical protein
MAGNEITTLMTDVRTKKNEEYFKNGAEIKLVCVTVDSLNMRHATILKKVD